MVYTPRKRYKPSETEETVQAMSVTVLVRLGANNEITEAGYVL